MHTVAYLLIWSLLVWTSTRSLNHVDWDELLPDLTTLCPNVDFCGKTQNVVEQDTEEQNFCCRECSCDRNCTATRDCCDGKVYNDSLSECLVPSTNQNQRLNTYRFIVRPPADGCKHLSLDDQEENVTCSSDETVAPWGNFLPVYSRSLDANFKNKPCARCHGALDVEKWTSILQIDYAPLFVGTLTQFIEKKILGGSDVMFRPPNSESTRFEKLCFRETAFCPNTRKMTFFIPSNEEMNRSSVIYACERGPSAKYLGPHGRAFKNIFCAICNGYARKFNDKVRCEHTLDNDREVDPPIRVLLDAVYMASLAEKNIPERKADDVCYRPEHEKNQTICESKLCPSMQTRLQTGKCGYVTKFLMTESLIVCLNLSTSQGPTADDIREMPDSQIYSLFEKNTPWSNKWFITLIGLLYSEKPRWLEFLVCLKLKSKQTNMEVLRKEIESSLTKRWMVNLKEATVFDQTISKHGRITGGAVGANVTADWIAYVANTEDDLTAPVWKIMYNLNLHVRSPLYFNQMFICEQIQLHPDEYNQSSPRSVLYQPKRHSYLYPNEFTALLNADSTWHVRVCLKDSGYIKVESGTETSLRVTSNVVIWLAIYHFLSTNIDAA